jgi:hypothetical protein
MSSPRTWQAYPSSYRATQMAVLARCIQMGESGSVIGLAGAGKSNLLGFLCHRPEVLRSYLPQGAPPVIPVLVDMNNMPGDDLATLYRVILRALYEAHAQLAAVDHSLDQIAQVLYRRVEDKIDPFLSQSALREALFSFQDRNVRLALVLDPFDAFCRSATLQVLDNVRGLRDSFKATLSYVVGLRQELAILRDPTDMGDLYEILDTHQCYVGAMEPEDARWVVRQVEETTGRSFGEADAKRLIALSGGHPSLLRASSLWLAGLPSRPREADWVACLLAERSVRHRLEELWTGISDQERRALSEVQRLQPSAFAPERDQPALDRAFQGLRQQHGDALARLAAAGLCEQVGEGWRVRGELLAACVDNAMGRSVDEVRLDEETGELYRGQVPLADLAPLEREALIYLLRHPHVRHTKTDLILNAWPDDPRPLERTDDSVYQVIRGLRCKIEPNPSKPRYIITWRGTGAQEGGYQFFPQGR